MSSHEKSSLESLLGDYEDKITIVREQLRTLENSSSLHVVNFSIFMLHQQLIEWRLRGLITTHDFIFWKLLSKNGRPFFWNPTRAFDKKTFGNIINEFSNFSPNSFFRVDDSHDSHDQLVVLLNRINGHRITITHKLFEPKTKINELNRKAKNGIEDCRKADELIDKILNNLHKYSLERKYLNTLSSWRDKQVSD